MRGRLAVIVAGLAVVLTACGVPVNGRTAIGVDAGGHLIVVLGWCGSTQPELVVISHEDERGEVSDGVYVAPRLTGQRASFRLDDLSGSGWQLEGAPKLREDIVYYASGRTANDRSSTAPVRFRLGDRDRLRPETVLVQDENDVDQVIGRDLFERKARDDSEVDCG